MAVWATVTVTAMVKEPQVRLSGPRRDRLVDIVVTRFICLIDHEWMGEICGGGKEVGVRHVYVFTCARACVRLCVYV